MRYADKNEIEEIKKYMNLAAEEALKSNCTKSKRGVVIVKDNRVIGRGYNKATFLQTCNPCVRENITDKTKVELCSAIHAEQMAILDALKKEHNLEGSRMYHNKVKNNKVEPVGAPCCTVCSRLVLESGISEFVLWHEEGYAIYDAKEFNEISFQYFISS